MVTKKEKAETKDSENIEPGMIVEATRGDLGEEDVSKPKVTEVIEDQQGNVDKLVVQKGVIFRKTLEIPADRITSVDQEAEQTSSQLTNDTTIPSGVSLQDDSRAAQESQPAPVKKAISS